MLVGDGGGALFAGDVFVVGDGGGELFADGGTAGL